MNISSDHAVLSQLRQGLAEGLAAADGRLPAERDLAERLGVNRGEIRKALAVLELEGSLRRHVGRGTFVTRTPPRRGLPDVAEVANTTSPPEAMQARAILEPELARLAALQATAAQIAELRRLAVAMRGVADWASYEALDYRFHELIAEAAGNRLLMEVERLVNGVRRAVVWGHLALRPIGPSPDYHSFDEHDAIVAAIARRDRPGAAEAMRRHLDSTAQALAG
ncbi:FadR/GntR family transcriptional regulator [Humitalea sp. 24SJ18S-53]|uniref:FadR/GntR family transcriptional regulator n=1 Tax=Humitalea sp. 24SJ18S-53 TaxID=3422307 RepID=UPI003D67CA4C